MFLMAANSIRFDRRNRDNVVLATAWQRLDCFAHLPTQSLIFVSAMSATMLGNGAIDVFVAADASGVTAMLPLFHPFGRFSRRRMIGAREVFEPVDALYNSPEAANALADALVGQSRPVELDRIPATSLLLPAMRRAIKRRGLMLVRPAHQCPTITLDAGWTEPESKFNAGRQSDFRRAERHAKAQGEVHYEVLSPSPREFDRLFDEAIAIEAKSWKSAAKSALAVDEEKRRFFHQFFSEACAKGELRLSFMRIDGKAVAMQMATQSGGCYWLFKIGFDETYRKCSPGNLLMLHTIRYAAQSGLGAFELMGNIEPWISDFWTNEQHDCVRVRTYPFNVAGMAVLAGDVLQWLRRRILVRQ
jgi:CelD/BcsL family acetyltransferase involved in cellulose biosynthesis